MGELYCRPLCQGLWIFEISAQDALHPPDLQVVDVPRLGDNGPRKAHAGSTDKVRYRREVQSFGHARYDPDRMNLFDENWRYPGRDDGAHHLVAALHRMPARYVDCHDLYLFNPHLIPVISPPLSPHPLSHQGVISYNPDSFFLAQARSNRNLHSAFTVDEVLGRVGVRIHHHPGPCLQCHSHHVAVGDVVA